MRVPCSTVESIAPSPDASRAAEGSQHDPIRYQQWGRSLPIVVRQEASPQALLGQLDMVEVLTQPGDATPASNLHAWPNYARAEVWIGQPV